MELFFLTTYAISYSLESILDRSIPNLFRISFGSQCSPNKAKEYWGTILDKLLPFVEHLNPAIENGLKNTKTIEQAVRMFNSLVKSTYAYNADIFSAFKEKIVAP